MTLYRWLQTPGLNSNSDTTINWAEGQAPSTVNDSARAMMAAVAKYRDDIAGAIVTAGTSTIYAVSSYEGYASLALLNGQMIAFTPHVTCGAPVSLNVDGLGAKPLRSAPNVEIPAGTLVQGTPYIATYNNSDGAFYLHGFYGNPYNVPLGGMFDYIGSSAPNSSFVLPFGQAISRSTYAALFALVGTTYGTGDGSTTFNVPDLRGRVCAGKDDMGGSAANLITNAVSGITGTTLGSTGGAQSVTLASAQIPAGVSSTVTGVSVSGSNGPVISTNATLGLTTISAGSGQIAPSVVVGQQFFSNPTLAQAGTGTATSTNGSQTAVNKMPPTIICNKILRII